MSDIGNTSLRAMRVCVSGQIHVACGQTFFVARATLIADDNAVVCFYVMYAQCCDLQLFVCMYVCICECICVSVSLASPSLTPRSDHREKIRRNARALARFLPKVKNNTNFAHFSLRLFTHYTKSDGQRSQKLKYCSKKK